MSDDPESEALLDKLYEEFLDETGLAATGWRRAEFVEKFKTKVRVYHAVKLGKILVELGMPKEEFLRLDAFLSRRG